MSSTSERWPSGCSAAMSITLDNMGEAADVHRGRWPEGEKVGSHFSVTETLPAMLELFDEFAVRVTYFVEGWNTSVYPAPIRDLVGRGHEVGFHGWQHETWVELDAETERELIAQNVAAFASIGVEVTGFRPPGGVLTNTTLGLLGDHGFEFCSPAGERAAMIRDIAVLPFDWQGIDAYYYSESFAPLRRIKGDPEEPLSPYQLKKAFTAIIEHRKRSGGYIALLFHPFLEGEQDRFNAMREVVELVVNDSDLWCAPCGDVARWVRGNREKFQQNPGLDRTSWTRPA